MNESIEFKNLISLVNKHCKTEGRVYTQIPSLTFFTTNEETEFQNIVYQPSLCLALQGEKHVKLGKELHTYNSSRYLLSCTTLPVDVKISTEDNKYIALVLRFTLDEIYEVIKETKKPVLEKTKKVKPALCFNKLDETITEPLYRLIKLLNEPQEKIDFIAPLIKKEILYTLVQNDEEFLKNYVFEGNIANQIVKVISEIKSNFSEPINVADIAKEMQVSEATFYHNFKKITSISPLQFQKRIRLEEAKQMLLTKNLPAHEVAFNVGYESASQFSREYSKMFGMSPKAHSEFLRTATSD